MFSLYSSSRLFCTLSPDSVCDSNSCYFAALRFCSLVSCAFLCVSNCFPVCFLIRCLTSLWPAVSPCSIESPCVFSFVFLHVQCIPDFPASTLYCVPFTIPPLCIWVLALSFMNHNRKNPHPIPSPLVHPAQPSVFAPSPLSCSPPCVSPSSA